MRLEITTDWTAICGGTQNASIELRENFTRHMSTIIALNELSAVLACHRITGMRIASFVLSPPS